MQTLKAVIARLAGAPLLAVRGPERRRSHRDDDARPAIDARTAQRRDGDEGESLARRHLERAGLVFVAGNVRYREGEIDLVMRERATDPHAQATMVFVEVRRRSGNRYGGALESVTFAKRRRLVAAAARYLTSVRVRTLPPCRFDIVTLQGDAARGLRIDWLRDAYRADG